jgi:aspartyl-tRNA(Asn)/glutamyl-tRNA(Gln) amidotransferase subunit A
MNDEELCYMPAVEMAAAIRAKKLSPVEVTEAVLRRIELRNPKLNAFCTLTVDEARATAKQAEAAVMRGEPLGLLHGVPVSIKDILYVRNVRTTFGSKLYENNVTTEDSPAVERMRKAGAVLLGQTNTPEFGWKGVTDNRVFGITRNPWNLALTPGGSSGGASSAVAAGLGPIGIGTDGGGSLRIPGSLCGLVGYKASFGRVPNYPSTGVDSLRHTGPLTRTVADAALTLQVLAGPDERDPASLPAAPNEFLAMLDRGIKGLRVAYSPDLNYAQVDPEVARMCAASARRLAEAGATVEEVKLDWSDSYDCWTVFFYGGIAARVADSMAEKGPLLDPGLRTVVDRGLKLRAVDYVNALIQRNAFWQRARLVFDKFDLLVTPTLAVTAFPVGKDKPDWPGGKEAKELQWSPFTYIFNLTGQPAVSIPCGWTEAGLPVGLQIVGRRFDDVGVLRAARAFEQIQPWAERRPAMKG